MTTVPPALPDRARNERFHGGHEFARLLLGKADMREWIKSNIRVPNWRMLVAALGRTSMREGITVQVSDADRAGLVAIVADRNSPQKQV